MSCKTPMAALSLSLTLSLAAQADETLTALERAPQERYPATRIERVQASEIPGLYEVMMGRNPAYTDATGRYFVFGHLFDLQTQRDLTAERLEAQQRVAFAELPFADAIKTIRGSGERLLAVFSDPDCPYCRGSKTNSRSSTTSPSTPSPIRWRACIPGQGQGGGGLVRARSRARLGRADAGRQGPAEAPVRAPDRAQHRSRAASGHPGHADAALRRRAPAARVQRRASASSSGWRSAGHEAGRSLGLARAPPRRLRRHDVGARWSRQFSCKAPDGITCASLSGVYANALQNHLPGQAGSTDAARSERWPRRSASACPASANRSAARRRSGASGSRRGKTTTRCCTTSRTSTGRRSRSLAGRARAPAGG
jgi:hypothetical protein